MFWALNLNCLSQGPPGPPGSVGMTGKKGELVRQSVYRLFICAPLCNFVRQWWCFDWQLVPRKLQVQISTCCPVFTVPESDICSHSKQPWTLFFTTGIALDFKFEIWTFNLPRAKCQSRMQHCVAILQSGVQTNNWCHSNCIQSPLHSVTENSNLKFPLLVSQSSCDNRGNKSRLMVLLKDKYSCLLIVRKPKRNQIEF